MVKETTVARLLAWIHVGSSSPMCLTLISPSRKATFHAQKHTRLVDEHSSFLWVPASDTSASAPKSTLRLTLGLVSVISESPCMSSTTRTDGVLPAVSPSTNLDSWVPPPISPALTCWYYVYIEESWLVYAISFCLSMCDITVDVVKAFDRERLPPRICNLQEAICTCDRLRSGLQLRMVSEHGRGTILWGVNHIAEAGPSFACSPSLRLFMRCSSSTVDDLSDLPQHFSAQHGSCPSVCP